MTKLKIPSLRKCRPGTQHPSATPEQHLMFTLQINLHWRLENWYKGERTWGRAVSGRSSWTWERGKRRKTWELLRAINVSAAKDPLDGSHGYRDITQNTSLLRSLAPWPRYPEGQSSCQRLKFCTLFQRNSPGGSYCSLRWEPFKPLYTHSQREAHIEYP